MKHLILGTAGHIDHGKTSLVKALTGIDTDRLKEEKARGISIELGFAQLELPSYAELRQEAPDAVNGIIQSTAASYRFGVVDVPGHEKFVRTMVAGVAGMDMVMLVIAADEGVMPQTREHLDILRLLGVKNGLVALTKCDLADPEWLPLVTLEVREFLSGSFLENSPIVHVSSKTGGGLEDLKAALISAATNAPRKRQDGPFRLPVDRLFTVTGFGTVVTGTLLSGEIRTGDSVELLPSGSRGKARGIQRYGAPTPEGKAGERLAVNLQGIDMDQAKRGDTLVPAGLFRTTRRVDIRLDHLKSAPRGLKHRSFVRLHTGTSETRAQIILFDRDTLTPGDSAYAQLRLDSPLLLVSGDPYLIRATSPPATIGGGIALDPFPPARRRRSDDALRLLESLNTAEHRKSCELIVAHSLLTGISMDEILLRSGIPKKHAANVIQELLESGQIRQMTRDAPVFLSKEAVAQLKDLIMGDLIRFTKANPLKKGMGKEELKSRLPNRTDQRFFGSLLTELENDGRLVQDRELICVAKTGASPSGIENPLAARLWSLLAEASIAPPTVRELALSAKTGEAEVRQLLSLLAREKRVVQVSSDIYYDSLALDGIRLKLVEHLQQNDGITPSDFREITGLSRKFMIPVLERFDREKLTIRVGEKRILRRR